MRKRLLTLPTLIRSGLLVLVGAGFGIAVAETRQEGRLEEAPGVRLRDLKVNSAPSPDPDARRLKNYLEERNPASEPSPPPNPQTVSPNAGLPGIAPEEK